MRSRVVCIAFGKGGHQEQMQRLIDKLVVKFPKDVRLVVFTDSTKPLVTTCKIDAVYTYQEARDKHSTINTLIKLPFTIIRQAINVCFTLAKYQVVGIVTTGPGVAIIPALICKLFNKKVIVFESWSRFDNASLTGKVLNKFSDLFFIQNESLKKVYKHYIYRGKL